MSQTQPVEHRLNSSKLLMTVGILWLLLAAVLLFYQLSTPVSIEVTWETATEVQTAGFYLYRSQSPQGDFVPLNQEDELIPGKGNALSGATYTYVDTDVVPGETYYYLLEEIEHNLSSNRYVDDIFAYTVPQATWWAVILTAISLLVGPTLLIAGLRENSKNL